MSATSAIPGLVVTWYHENARELPWRRPGVGPWAVLVSEVMLQQTPAARVVPRFEEWMRRWPEPAALAATPPGEAVRAWRNLGYPRRALRLHACAVAIAEEHAGEVPDDVDALLALPGIGHYTARAIASFAYGLRHPVVDTNIRRVLARAVRGQAEPGPPSTRRDLADMAALLPAEGGAARDVNAGTMELGALVCVARSPRCDVCPLAAVCAWHTAGHPGYDGPRRTPQARYEGSDRQARGTLLRALRHATTPVPAAELAGLWPDAPQRDRALAGLLADGLAARTPAGYTLP